MKKENRESQKRVILIGELKVKDEYRNLIPKPIQDDFERLRADIKENGLCISIIINDGNIILDGHQRYEIAKEFNLKEVPFGRMTFNDELEEKRFIIAVNFHRRNLNPAQRAELALKLKEIETEMAKRRQEATRFVGRGTQKKDVELVKHEGQMGGQILAPPSDEKGRVLDIVGRKVGLSRGTLSKVQKIKEAARNDKDIAKEWNQALAGRKKIHKVFLKVDRIRRRKELEDYEVKSDELLQQLNRNIQLGDFNELGNDIPDDSVDLIFTDPMYDDDSLHLYEEVAILGRRILKESGSLVCYAALPNLPIILNLMSKHLTYWWVICEKYRNNHPRIGGRAVFSEWKPLLWFVKGERRNTQNYLRDFIESKKPEKEYNRLQQSVETAEYFITNLTNVGDLVLDPMLGTGTTGVATFGLKRQFIGIEINPEMHQIALKRIARFIEKGRDGNPNETNDEGTIIAPERSLITPEFSLESDTADMVA